MVEQAKRFDALFDGLRRAYGYYLIDANQTGAKQKGRGGYKYEPVTPMLWQQHLDGKGGIGIVPIRDDATCSWGALDIDVYVGLDLQKLAAKIEAAKMPLVVCRSKSGGAHVFLFTSEPVPASLMREKVKLLASWLGHGDAEIFPKQVEINVERKDIGNYLNMPYESGVRTVRYGVKPDSAEPMTIDEFLDHAEGLRLSGDQLTKLQVEAVKPKVRVEIFEQGPPCLEVIHANGGLDEGGRNNGLLNYGILFVKAFPESWEGKLAAYNDEHVHPPLPFNELQEIIKSLKKKLNKSDDGGYCYTCKKPPIMQHCNSFLCKARKYGITDTDNELMPISGLQRLNTKPPIFIATLEDGRTLDLEAMDLQNQRTFQRKCIEQLNTVPKPMSDKQWRTLIQDLLDKISIIEVPEESTAQGVLMFHLEQFCTQFGQARDWSNIHEGLPFCDGEHHWFRMPDFAKYLQRQKFNDLDKAEIANTFRNKGVMHKQKILMVDGKRMNTSLYYCLVFESYKNVIEDEQGEKSVM